MEQERKINESIEDCNPENLKSLLLNHGKEFDLEKYREALKNVVKSFKIRKDPTNSNGWEVEKEDVYGKKTKEIFRLEKMLGKFKLRFQEQVAKLGKEIQEVFCLSELDDDYKSRTPEKDAIVIEYQTFGNLLQRVSSSFNKVNAEDLSKNDGLEGVWCKSPDRKSRAQDSNEEEVKALGKGKELIEQLELNQNKEDKFIDERSLHLSQASAPNHEKNEIITLDSQKTSIEKKAEVYKTDDEKLKEYVFSAFGCLNPVRTRQELKRINIKRQSFTYDGILNERLYRGSREVRCHFCQESSSEKELYSKLGQLFGPFRVKEENYYFHEMCVLWSAGVEMDQQNSIEHSIEAELERTKGIRCLKCGLTGAGVLCLESECREAAHFRCMISMKEVKLNYNKLGFFCEKHFKRGKKERKVGEKNMGKVENRSKKIKKDKNKENGRGKRSIE